MMTGTMVFTLVLLLAGCSANTPEGTVKGYLNAVKSHDAKKLESYGGASESLSKDLKEFDLSDSSKKGKDSDNTADEELIEMIERLIIQCNSTQIIIQYLCCIIT